MTVVADVLRDPHGIPHVVAESTAELMQGQGRVTALDRTWQLEHARRKAEGRLAEILGPRALPWDTLARRYGLVEVARRAYDALSAEARALVDEYVAGINAGLAEAPAVPELDETGVVPGVWQPWTSLAVFAAHHLLFATYPNKLWRAHLQDTLGPDVAPLFHHEGLWAAGSNSWAVGGARTASGLPLVAGDPHRTFESPNAYQQVRLTCPGVDVSGFTFPGVPGVQHFAHAGSVAWGITNAMADYQDVFAEDLVREDDGTVLARDGERWHVCDRSVERVEVRGGEAVEVEVLVTHNGPVVVGGPGDTRALSLRTASWVLGSLGFDALPGLLAARTADDVLRAFSSWVEPVNNLVVADTGGTVRQQVVGRVPVRHETHHWRPVSGSDPAHRWTGWLDPLPGRDVAPDEHVVTANHRMEGFDALGVEFAPPSRARRIEALLEGRVGLTVEDLAEIHRDTLLPEPHALVEAVLALDGLTAQGAELQAALDGWDRRMEAGSREAAAYAAIRERLVGRLAAHPALRAADFPDAYGPMYSPWFLLDLQLSLSLLTLLSPEGRRVVHDLDDHLRAVVEDVAADPPPPWGEGHRLQPLHALGHELHAPPAVGGDTDCVMANGTLPGSDVSFRGSVARYAWDLASRAASGWVVPLGAAGDPRSPHHHDQTTEWVAGRLLPLEPPA